MVDLQIYKIGVDVLLVMSLLYLCFRIGKSSGGAGIARIPGLEEGLKTLIKDADESSRELNAKLLKRKSNLENLLYDLETVESRVNRAVTSAEEAKGFLDLEISKAGRIRQEIAAAAPEPRSFTSRSERVAAEAPQPRVAPQERYVERERYAAPIERPAGPIDPYVPEPASFTESVEQRQVREPQQSREQEKPAEEESRANWSNRNIYGELIPSAPVQPNQPMMQAKPARPEPKDIPQQDYTPLVSEIETERHNPYSIGETANDELQKVYDAAENMLRTGMDLKTVSARTNLPMDEVKVLAQMMERESIAVDEEVVVDVSDSRLGVLGGMKRRTQTL